MLKISLQTKIFILISIVLLVAMGSLSALSIQFLRQEKKSALFEVHRSELRRLSSEIKLRLLTLEETTQKLGKFSSGIESEILVSLEYDFKAKSIQVISSNPEKLKAQQLNLLEVERSIKDQRSFLFEKGVDKVGLEKISIAPSPNDWLAYKRLVEDQNGNPIKTLLVIFDPQKLSEIFRSFSMGHLLWLSSSGQSLISSFDTSPGQEPSSEQKETANINEVIQTLFKISESNSSSNLTLEFDSQAKNYFGGFEKLGEKTLLISFLSEENAMLGVANLTERILIVTVMTLTIAFIVSVLFSKSLTEPLNILVARMKLAGTGDFLSPIHIKTADEIRELADGFKEMMKEIKESKDQLEEVNRNLESKVKERTLELERQNLIVKEAQEALLKTTRLASAGEVAGRAAHEVLNPLTSLLARVDVFEQRALTEKRDVSHFFKEMIGAWKQDYAFGGFEKLQTEWAKPSQVAAGKNLFEEDLGNLETISATIENSSLTTQSDLEFMRNEGKRIIKIVNGMRKLSQPQSDRRQHSLHTILKESKVIMNDLFSKKGFEIQLECSAKVDLIEIDKDELLQVLTNLMRNSLQSLSEAAVPSGVFKIITENKAFDGQNSICALIIDNGIGIADENQKKLFEKQFTTKNRDEGTGLGLSIARRLVRSNGGDLEFVRSQKFKETVFMMKFPIAKAGELPFPDPTEGISSDKSEDLKKRDKNNKGAVA